jgi:hypothetical protein
MTRAWLAGVLALALLAAGRAALLHPLEHVDEHGRFVHLAGTDGGDARGENDRENGNPSDRLGDSLAALAACAVQVQLFSGDARPDYRIPAYPARAPRVADAPPFRSHGPPVPA